MKYVLWVLFGVCLMVMACGNSGRNPLLSDFDAPFGVPPFEQIKEKHFLPAFDKGIQQNSREIDAIAKNADAPTFANTLEAMESSGELLTRVSSVFYNLNSAHTNDELQSIAKEVAPKLSKHRDDILLNRDLFLRIKALWERRDQLDLTAEQARLLQETFLDFVQNGANLEDDDKAELRRINEELSLLTLQFGENVLKEDNAFELVIENPDDLAGLPQVAVETAAEEAAKRGYEGKWVFTLHKPSLIPFLQYSEKRDLREKMFTGYIMRGDNNNELDNKALLSRIAALRVRRANLLGYPTHAHFQLERNMANNPDRVYDLLHQLWKPALKRAKAEAAKMQKLIIREGDDFKLQPWDWWYYAEKVKQAEYSLDEEQLRPYFKLENVIDGVFEVANRLFGIEFTERTDLPVYHPEVKTFEVKEADGTHIGILYTDYFPRASKRGGAWMSSYRKQSNVGGNRKTPIIVNCGNFAKPTAEKPSLLSVDEVETLFHEFGHALHGLLSDCTYPSLSGTSVAVDFVELPSQIMENWALHPEVLKLYARHYETGAPMPDELIAKLEKTSHFNQGFATVEYLAASFLDMDWHTVADTTVRDAIAFENESLGRIRLMPEIVARYRSPYFRHIFSGGYSAGYYSYIWAEVLDADAFQAFKEKGLFDRDTAQAFRKNILSAGGTDDPMVLYKKFRGKEPEIRPLLLRRGLNGF
ncbi:M3 family metallopeptidase [candidate division KSB1 bacterium]|nr:M3 family metallopeptidase [candidate division KSB1 bacterium]